MPNHPSDRFDDVPADLQRVGAHRAPRRPRRALWVFGWAALATGVLVLAGVIAITVIGSNNAFTGTLPLGPTTAEEATATAEPVIDESLVVTVLNGSSSAGLAIEAADALTDDGWTIGSRANASSDDIETTTVYYWDPADEGPARGLARSLGVSAIELSDTYAPAAGDDPDVAARLTVVLGADYAE
ncbi:LytR C-terminal domain-containing protein [Planctomonas psychrotolerans]|uniref:LytR C-terminal domain-containing protein n=1 Tax=Planctomonas psychrotolerans TaxID=2528712 RepID=UPI00123A8341|nr:LytR C-terminal domain-containing protein [Planctomonas psychrotolerans]